MKSKPTPLTAVNEELARVQAARPDLDSAAAKVAELLTEAQAAALEWVKTASLDVFNNYATPALPAGDDGVKVALGLAFGAVAKSHGPNFLVDAARQHAVDAAGPDPLRLPSDERNKRIQELRRRRYALELAEAEKIDSTTHRFASGAAILGLSFERAAELGLLGE